jgi:hypothetical protein
VKFRDRTNPDPEVQRQHEQLDAYYDAAIEQRERQCRSTPSA